MQIFFGHFLDISLRGERGFTLMPLWMSTLFWRVGVESFPCCFDVIFLEVQVLASVVVVSVRISVLPKWRRCTGSCLMSSQCLCLMLLNRFNGLVLPFTWFTCVLLEITSCCHLSFGAGSEYQHVCFYPVALSTVLGAWWEHTRYPVLASKDWTAAASWEQQLWE